MTSTFLYFAYGSNMLTERLVAANRCPSAKPVGLAYAPGYTLEFSKRSTDTSGKATLVRSPGARQYGVLFSIDEAEQSALDREEGKAYRAEPQFGVIRLPDQEPLAVRTYLAIESQTNLKPFDWYLALVLAGAREHGLPEAQISQLRQTTYDVDPKGERPARIDALKALGAAGLGMPADVLGE